LHENGSQHVKHWNQELLTDAVVVRIKILHIPNCRVLTVG